MPELRVTCSSLDGLAALEAGDPRRARELSIRAADIGHRFDDADLHTFGTLCQGQALIALGEPDAGVDKLDEVMVAGDDRMNSIRSRRESLTAR